MEESNFNVVIRPEESAKYPAGIAFIVLPDDVDRDIYIRQCYETSCVSIYSENNGFYNRVPVDKYSLNFIEFPKESGEHGSPVSFKMDPIKNTPFVDGIYFNADELSELEENQFRFKRKLDENFVEIVGSPKSKLLALTVSTDSKGEINISIKSKDKSGKLNVHVDGDTSIISTGQVKLKQFEKYTCVTVNALDNEEFSVHQQTSTEETFYNENHNINSKNVTVVAEKNNFRKVEEFKINDGEEPFVLGKKFAKLMKDFIQEVSKATVATSIGTQPLINAEEIVAYKEQVDELLSKIVFVDK